MGRCREPASSLASAVGYEIEASQPRKSVGFFYARTSKHAFGGEPNIATCGPLFFLEPAFDSNVIEPRGNNGPAALF
jgi:hypothetical protein